MPQAFFYGIINTVEKESKIPFRYLGSNNVDNVVNQIYGYKRGDKRKAQCKADMVAMAG